MLFAIVFRDEVILVVANLKFLILNKSQLSCDILTVEMLISSLILTAAFVRCVQREFNTEFEC